MCTSRGGRKCTHGWRALLRKPTTPSVPGAQGLPLRFQQLWVLGFQGQLYSRTREWWVCEFAQTNVVPFFYYQTVAAMNHAPEKSCDPVEGIATKFSSRDRFDESLDPPPFPCGSLSVHPAHALANTPKTGLKLGKTGMGEIVMHFNYENMSSNPTEHNSFQMTLSIKRA